MGGPNELEGIRAHHFLLLSPHMLTCNGVIKNTLSRCIYFTVEWLAGFATSPSLSPSTFSVCVCVCVCFCVLYVRGSLPLMSLEQVSMEVPEQLCKRQSPGICGTVM